MKQEQREFLESFAEIDTNGNWVTKDRKDYVTIAGEGELEKIKFLLEFGITESIQSTGKLGHPIQIGYNPETQKWYGWSHRAIHSFGVGSTCKKGDAHYQAANKQDFLEQCTQFWQDEYRVNVVSEDEYGRVYTSWEYTESVPNQKLRGSINGVYSDYPEKFGRGEWVAETLEDAKQMAIDFAKGVS